MAVLAVALAVPRNTTTVALSQMLPAEVLSLHLPARGWYWVVRWLRFRRYCDGDASDHQPWVALSRLQSSGAPRQIGWGATRALHLVGMPGWRLGQLVHAEWSCDQRPMDFEEWSRWRSWQPWVRAIMGIRDRQAAV